MEEYRRADNEVAFEKFSGTDSSVCCAGCTRSVMGRHSIIFWRNAYYHLECAFVKLLSEKTVLETIHD